jgi:DNA-binding CsgD family transcriptional regulator
LRILFSNDQAKRILDGRFFLRIHDDHLAAAESALERQVSTVLSRVLNPERSEEGRPGMRIRTPGGAADLWIYPEKLDLPHAPRRRGGAEIAVTLIASDEEALLRPDLLAALFRLTPAEARVASLAGLGMPLSEVAERCGTKILTVKSQLSQVYKKLGVNRQGELAILMVRAAGL